MDKIKFSFIFYALLPTAFHLLIGLFGVFKHKLGLFIIFSSIINKAVLGLQNLIMINDTFISFIHIMQQ